MGVSGILGMSRSAFVCLYRDAERKLQTWVDVHRNLLTSAGICGRLSTDMIFVTATEIVEPLIPINWIINDVFCGA